jgi:carboxymethylenebutenolidase
VATHVTKFPSIVAAVVYADSVKAADVALAQIPVLRHFAGKPLADGVPQRTESLIDYYYAAAPSHKFATPFHDDFQYNAESLSHTRNLTFLKELMGAPKFDLERIWDEHTYYEFADRSVEHTMSTMVQEPYVNHVPTVSS